MTVGSASTPVGLRGVFAARRARSGRRRRTSAALLAVFVLPSLIIYGLFMVYPLLGTIQLSLTSWDGYAATKDFIGLDNYAVLSRDAAFWNALIHNLIWAVAGPAAPILDRQPSVVAGIIWGWIYNPLFGVLNALLDGVGLESISKGWLGDPDTALWAVLIAAIWGAFGTLVVFFLAGLQAIDLNLIDAARVDGANVWQRARHVILPGIAPMFTFVFTITLVGAFSVFDIVYVLTLGGPGTATEVLAGYAYKMAFGRNFAGYGAAISMIIAILSLVLA